MVGDDGHEILDETRNDLTCDHGIGQEKFTAIYKVENCADFEASGRSSKRTSTVNTAPDWTLEGAFAIEYEGTADALPA